MKLKFIGQPYIFENEQGEFLTLTLEQAKALADVIVHEKDGVEKEIVNSDSKAKEQAPN